MDSEIQPDLSRENVVPTVQNTTHEDEPETSTDAVAEVLPNGDGEAQGLPIPSLAAIPLASLTPERAPHSDPLNDANQALEPHGQVQHTIKVESDNMDGILPTQAVTIPALSEHIQDEDPLHNPVLEVHTPVQPMAVDELGVGVDPDAVIPSLKAELVENIEGDVNMSVDLGLPAASMGFHSTGKYECRLILSGHTLSISSLKFSPDGKMLASAAADKTVKLWDAETGQIIKTFEGHTSGISDVAWANDSEFVASASDDKTIRIWSLDMGGTAKVLIGHTNFVFCLNYNPSGSLLASGGYDESVRIWDVARGKTTKVLPAHSDPVTAVSFNHDGTLVVSCAMDGLVRIWDADSGQCLKTLVDDDNPVCSHVRFSPNSKFILVSTQDSTVRLWNFDKSRPVKSYVGHANKTYCIFACFGRALDIDGVSERQVVLSGSEDNKVYIWDLQTRQVVQTLEGHRDAVLAVAMHPTQKIIASASKERDLSIRLWHS